jgi:hypothetical protein
MKKISQVSVPNASARILKASRISGYLHVEV